MLNYYENEFFKIKIYNKNKFKIDIDDNENIIIHRTGGWANDIEINIRYKTLFLDEIIKVSSSNKNTQKIKLNETNKDINVKLHYENDKYKIFYISEEFNDIFSITYQNKKINSYDIIFTIYFIVFYIIYIELISDNIFCIYYNLIDYNVNYNNV
jgi:hypothetical protein